MFLKQENQSVYDTFLETVKNDDAQLKDLCKSECIRLSEIAKEYLLDLQTVYSDLLSKTVRKEYSKGGELLPRGFYCPSPIRDIVTGNCKRGKLYKRLTSGCKPTYEYCFDENDRLILINYLYLDCTEFLAYSNNTVVGVAFSKGDENKIIQVIECNYDGDGKIVSFAVAHSCHNDCVFDELEKEVYSYNKDGLTETEIVHYLSCEESEVVNYEKYNFKHDKDGYLSEYISEPSVFDTTYKVNTKRRV